MTAVEDFINRVGARKVRLRHSIVVDNQVVEHHGVKGQKWGIRNRRTSKAGSVVAKPKAHDLSDEELKKAVGRMQMEKQYNQLIGAKSSSRGKKAVKVGAAFVGGIALNVAKETIKNQASSKVNAALAKKVKP